MINRCAYGAGFSFLLLVEPSLANSDRDCRQVVSNVERLACFDDAAGTPARFARQLWSAPELDAPSVSRVVANEQGRDMDDLTFRANVRQAESAGRDGLVISAPAIASVEPRPYLAISCVQNISRLQLITGRPLDGGWFKVQLQGERSASATTAWQVMENGQVLDAGRGLPAIEQIKKLIGAHRIHVVSDNAAVDGLTFDAQGLDPLINQARSTCRW